MGDIGFQETIIDDPQNEQALAIIRELGNLLITAAEEAEEYDELVSSIFDHPLTTPSLQQDFSLPPLCKEPNFADDLFRGAISCLEEIDEVAKTRNEQIFMNLVNELDIHGCLHKGTRICLHTLCHNPKNAEKYSHHFLTELPPLIDRLIECGENPETTSVTEWKQLLRRAYPLVETALPPVVALIEFVSDGRYQPEMIWGANSYNFNHQVEIVSNFDPLDGLLTYPEDYALRNAVSHGGATGLYHNEPQARWRIETHQRKYKVSEGDFPPWALRVGATSIGLCVLPIYLTGAAATVDVIHAT